MSRASEGIFRVGTRGSALARWQAEWVASRLTEHGIAVQLELITTRGDATTRPIGEMGGQGLFTKEIQRALLDERVDIAVHSLKDLPTEAVPALRLAAVPPRAGHRDALIAREHATLAELPAGASVGTGSKRRQTQLWHARPDLVIASIRGNVETRLAKLAQGEFDAIVLAEAGLQRLGLTDRISEILSEAVMLPAVGQGALGLECRADDARTRDALRILNDPDSEAAVRAERSLLANLRGGCLAPIAAWGRVVHGQLVLDAAVLSPDGKRRLFVRHEGDVEQPEPLGTTAAEALLSQGAAELIDESRQR